MPRRLGSGLLLALIVSACGTDASTAHPASEDRTAPEVPQEPPPAAPTAETRATAPHSPEALRDGLERPTAQEIEAFATTLREARVATREERWDVAMVAFDQLVMERPRDPSVRCEAGYVAFLAGQHTAAAEHLDTGLYALGSPALLDRRSERLLAMCLFNRGLVYEALGETEHARDRYGASLRVRPNRTVEERRRLLDMGQSRVELLNAPDVRQLVHEQETRGCRPEEDSRRCGYSVQVLARLAGSGTFPEVAMLRLEPRDAGLVDVDIVLYVRRAGGFEERPITSYGYDNTMHAGCCGYQVRTRVDELEVTGVAGRPLVQARLRQDETTLTSMLDLGVEDAEACYEGWSGVTRSEYRLFCRLEPELSCDLIRVGFEVETYIEHARCTYEEEEDEDPASWRRSFSIGSDGAVRMHTITGAPDPPLAEDSTVDGLLASSESLGGVPY